MNEEIKELCGNCGHSKARHSMGYCRHCDCPQFVSPPLPGKALVEKIAQFITDYRDAAERHALAETPLESAHYILSLIAQSHESWAKANGRVRLDKEQTKPAIPDEITEELRFVYEIGQTVLIDSGFRKIDRRDL